MENLGMYIDPKTLPLMYQYNYDLACLKGGSSGWCIVDSHSWVGSDIRRYPEDLCSTGMNISDWFSYHACFDSNWYY